MGGGHAAPDIVENRHIRAALFAVAEMLPT
jgi:hypothetical protein